MNRATCNAMLGLCILFGSLTAGALAQNNGDAAKKLEELKVDSYRRMTQPVSTKDYQEKLPFAMFLQSLSKQLSDDKKFTVRLDREAFGKDADRMLNEMVLLPPVPVKMVANTALRIALSQTPRHHDYEIEFGGGPDELIITTRDRSLYTVTYDIGNLLKHTRYLHEVIERETKIHDGEKPGAFLGPFFSLVDSKADPDKADEWIVRQIVAWSSDRAGWRHPKLPSTIQVLNGKKLVIHTAPSVHESIRRTLDTMLKLADVTVVMNARLYEVDRATYDKDFASLFIDPKDKLARRPVAKLIVPLLKKLKQQKLILEAESAKIRPFQQVVFVSLRNAHQYIAGPGDPDTEPARVFGSVYDGFTWAVRPTVSPDRRCLRLEISQDAGKLVKLTKGAIVDLKSDKEIPIDLPNVKKTSTSTIIEIHDLQPIVLAVDYRPAAKDRVWLLLAEPMIYIEQEQERLRKQAIRPMLMADEKPPLIEPVSLVEEEKPFAKPMPVELPDNKDVKEILQGIVESVLTDPKIDAFNGHYAMRGDKRFTLIQGSAIAWPRAFRPTVTGYTHVTLDPDECHGFKKRLLGIRIDEFKWTPRKGEPTEATIDIVLDNAIGGALGACHVIYHAKREGKVWNLQWSELYTR
jgi:hypothetical protein